MKIIYKKGTKIIKKVQERNIPLIITESMKNMKKSCTHCPLCQCKLNSMTRLPAYNHNHFNGLFYSILCVKCNILCVKQALVVISHSFGDLDGPDKLKGLKREWTQKLKMIAKDDD